MSKLGTQDYFHGGGGAVNAGVLGTLYIPFILGRESRYRNTGNKTAKTCPGLYTITARAHVISSQSSTLVQAENESMNYVFIYPPFGSNLNYSELSFRLESG